MEKEEQLTLPIEGNIFCLDAWTYSLPIRGFNSKNEMVIKGLMQIDFARGAKDNLDIERKDGIFIADVIKMSIDRLAKIALIVPSPENAEALGHLKSALDLLQRRTVKRIEANVQGTYKELPKEILD